MLMPKSYKISDYFRAVKFNFARLYEQFLEKNHKHEDEEINRERERKVIQRDEVMRFLNFT